MSSALLHGTSPIGTSARAEPSAWPIVALISIAGLLRLAFSSSLSGNDDVAVANCALRLLDGGWANPGGHYCARYGLTLPLAAVFRIAGTGAAQISLVPALADLAGILLAWRLGTVLLGPATGLAAAAMLALFPMDIEFAGLAFPDASQGALMAGAVLCILLAAKRDGARGWALAILSGLLWAWAYFVKLDAFFLAAVLLSAALLRLARWQHALAAGCVALTLVGMEIVGYALLTGDPLQRVHWESAAANEILAPGHDYRNLMVYPRIMFLVPYEAGLNYYLLLAGCAAAIWTRSRPALFLMSWCLLWQLWLAFGADPLSGFRLKPQVGRYLLSWAVPMAVLAGWALALAWRHARPFGLAILAGAAACAALFAPFNQLAYEPAQATRVALSTAKRNGWFPLYPDLQSLVLIRFLLHGRPEAPLVRPVQIHDFLQGTTRFTAIGDPRAYLLINQDYARRLQERSLVRPIEPGSFGRAFTLTWQVDNPMPPVSYAALRFLTLASRILPASVHAHIGRTASEILQGGDAQIYQLGQPTEPNEALTK